MAILRFLGWNIFEGKEDHMLFAEADRPHACNILFLQSKQRVSKK